MRAAWVIVAVSLLSGGLVLGILAAPSDAIERPMQAIGTQHEYTVLVEMLDANGNVKPAGPHTLLETVTSHAGGHHVLRERTWTDLFGSHHDVRSVITDGFGTPEGQLHPWIRFPIVVGDTWTTGAVTGTLVGDQPGRTGEVTHSRSETLFGRERQIFVVEHTDTEGRRDTMQYVPSLQAIVWWDTQSPAGQRSMTLRDVRSVEPPTERGPADEDDLFVWNRSEPGGWAIISEPFEQYVPDLEPVTTQAVWAPDPWGFVNRWAWSVHLRGVGTIEQHEPGNQGIFHYVPQQPGSYRVELTPFVGDIALPVTHSHFQIHDVHEHTFTCQLTDITGCDGPLIELPADWDHLRIDVEAGADSISILDRHGEVITSARSAAWARHDLDIDAYRVRLHTNLPAAAHVEIVHVAAFGLNH